jgi:excisionase family DNA binding protein
MKTKKEFDLRDCLRGYFPEDNVIPVNLSIETAGKLIGISRPSVYPLMASGELESIRIKGRRLIPTRSVVAYLGRISS